MGVDIKADVSLDAKGMICPLPFIRTKKVMDLMQSGQILEVEVTDPGSKSDMNALLSRLGHELLNTGEEGGAIRFYIRKR